MAKTILWLDDDRGFINKYIEDLEKEGFTVFTQNTLSECQKLLNESGFDLFILDVMIPPSSEEEEKRFKKEFRNRSQNAGLYFYIRNRQKLIQSKTPVMIFTIKLDIKKLNDQFLKEGLPPDSFYTKFNLRTKKLFLEKINEIINREDVIE